MGDSDSDAGKNQEEDGIDDEGGETTTTEKLARDEDSSKLFIHLKFYLNAFVSVL